MKVHPIRASLYSRRDGVLVLKSKPSSCHWPLEGCALQELLTNDNRGFPFVKAKFRKLASDTSLI